MNDPLQQLEIELIEQTPSIKGNRPKLSELLSAATNRRRRRQIRTGMIVFVPVVIASILSLNWIGDFPVAGYTPSTESQSDKSMVSKKLDGRNFTAKSNRSKAASTDKAVSTPLVSNYVVDDGFRVYATWTIPVLVKEEKTDGTMAHVVRELQVRRKIDATTLNQFEINSIRSVLPTSQERPDIL